uniref:RRM domain-containing protein n=1 Tax=Oryza punctata TaxID=4537 RepID=A0A0E0JSN4_ORYPU
MAARALLSRLRFAPLSHHHLHHRYLDRALSAAAPPPDDSPPPPHPPPPSNSKLFVAGLSWSADERSLTDAFSSFGTVTEVRIMYDKNSGRSRGFGFVHFSNEYEAKCAKDAMDGKVMLGRPLRISFALDKVRGAPVVVPRLSTVSEMKAPSNGAKLSVPKKMLGVSLCRDHRVRAPGCCHVKFRQTSQTKPDQINIYLV